MEPPAEVYVGLREQALAVGAEQLEGESAGRIYALLMETGYPQAVATLVGLADGTTSMYFSNGGGIIGGGQHERVAAATLRWLELGERFVDDFASSGASPELPREGETQFVAVTSAGRFFLSAPEEDLGEHRHHAAPLFHAAHEVITELRLIDEASSGGT